MPYFKPNNYNQVTVMVINFLEQLELDPFALTVHHLIDNKIDLFAERFFYSLVNFKGEVDE